MGFMDFLSNLGSGSQLRKLQKIADQVNLIEEDFQEMSDAELKEQTDTFKERLEDGEDLDQLLPEAFATVREASVRVLNKRHFDVQIMGGAALHWGNIAEMKTGEGKTLVGTLPSYLNALSGDGVHIVTTNDYLAKYQSEQMGRIHHFLGLEVGVILASMSPAERRLAYRADITYGTNNEFGFDYLRDNMALSSEDLVQRGHHFAIVDEVDSILIDEARTPLIISGPAEENAELYVRMNAVPPMLTPMESEPKQGEEDPPGDYWVDHKAHQAYLSEAGHEHAEQILTQLGLLPEGASLYDAANISLVHHLMVALRAHTLFLRDQHYVVQNDEVVIVDEFTGRLMAGRRWSDGLHQAVEAKEGVKIQAENQTLASITFQNYFRMYEKLAGMTGTADTEAYEFQEIYNLETVVVPTHRPMVRNDMQDLVYRTAKEKYDAILADIRDCHERGQPVLVGTTTIENSELVSHLLNRANLPHNVLNAKEHEREALIVAQAGKPGMITVATNMAGRGTDIVLGGNVKHQSDAINADETLSDEEKAARIHALESSWEADHNRVLEAGGLHIIGTERHESRRIDNQLRGRAGRQGDPGSSRFYLSFEDPLLRLFALDRAAAILNKLAPERGVAIEAGILTRQIENAQRKVEGRNFDMRKQVLEYDDVANDQRKVLYHWRNEVLQSNDVSGMMKEMREMVISNLVAQYIPPNSMEEQWDVPALTRVLAEEFNVHVDIAGWLREDNSLENEDITEKLLAHIEKDYAAKIALLPEAKIFHDYERSVLMSWIDHSWREHLAAMDYLRQGIHLRGYAQKNPKQEYKREAFEMFNAMWYNIRANATKQLISVRVQDPEEVRAQQEAEALAMQALHADAPDMQQVLAESRDTLAREAFDPNSVSDEDAQYLPDALEAAGKMVHRNDPCPCGSGLKYKQCHGRLA